MLVLALGFNRKRNIVVWTINEDVEVVGGKTINHSMVQVKRISEGWFTSTSWRLPSLPRANDGERGAYRLDTIVSLNKPMVFVCCAGRDCGRDCRIVLSGPEQNTQQESEKAAG